MPDRLARTVLLISMLLLSNCRTQNIIDPRLSSEMPQKILWAWERPEDLTFIDPSEFGVAFLAQTLLLENDRVMQKARRQPLAVPPGTYLIAVTRIETNKESGKHAYFDEAMVKQSSQLIGNTLTLPDVRAIQVDFDAVASERKFYRELMFDLDHRLKTNTSDDGQPRPHIPLTMTSLASWCTGDAWFNDFPVAEAVPMAFQMGSDTEKIKMYLRNGNDWNEPLCRGSYGISLDEGIGVQIDRGRRVYYFKSEPWKPSDLDRLNATH